MKKNQIIAAIIAAAKAAKSLDDFDDRLLALDKALSTWRVKGGIFCIQTFVDDDITDPEDPAWTRVTVMRYDKPDFDVDCSEYMKGKI